MFDTWNAKPPPFLGLRLDLNDLLDGQAAPATGGTGGTAAYPATGGGGGDLLEALRF